MRCLTAGGDVIASGKGGRDWCGFRSAHSPGSAVHDEIELPTGLWISGFTGTKQRWRSRKGAFLTGKEFRCAGYLKPISTLRRPFNVGGIFASREPVKAAYERSRCLRPSAAGVAAEAMVASPSRVARLRNLVALDEGTETEFGRLSDN